MDQQGIRLQKVMAQAGVGSRRVCEDMIEAGRVQVNDKRVTEQGMRVDPATDVIKVDGLRIVTNDTHVYLALNKPVGMLSTMSDELGRPCPPVRWGGPAGPDHAAVLHPAGGRLADPVGRIPAARG